MVKQTQPQRRKRGVILSAQGWQRLQAAEQQIVDRANSGKPYTLEQLGQKTGLSPNTITKVRQRRMSVDRQTLEVYFNALGLLLNPTDYVSIDGDVGVYPGLRSPLQGQIPLDSPFYIERPPIEQLTLEEMMQPGSLIRIKAPNQFGKTSLMARVLAAAEEKGYRGVALNLQLADTNVFGDLDRFLRWFCAVVTRSLDLPNHLGESWNDLFGASYNCTDYFERHLLTAIEGPLVLALDSVDLLFNHPAIAADFLGMLRAWYEKSRYGNSSSAIWQQLRLILVHTTENIVPLQLNQSPFNVGLFIELPSFTVDQVQELAKRYGIENTKTCATHLHHWLGGHPYLTQLALHYLRYQHLSLEEITQDAIEPSSIFSAHLWQQLGNLQPYPELLLALKQVVSSAEPVDLHPIQAFKLRSLGLVQLSHLQALPGCQLYQQFFAPVLSMT